MPTRKIDNFTIDYTDSDELLALKREIFTEHCYYFETENPQPKIIDLGAHIGLSTLYFKKLFPAANIAAVEPNPAAVALLETNLWQNDMQDVEVIAAAVAPHERPLTLHQDVDQTWLSTTSVHERAWNSNMTTSPLTHTVKTISLNSLLEEPVELVKMDIEGMEQVVLSALSPATLQNIKQLIIEFHPTADQNLEMVIDFLERARFSTTVSKNGKSIAPNRARGLVMIHAVRTK